MSDLDALIAFEKKFFTFDHQISRRSFRHFIGSSKSNLIVADAGGKVAGCLLVNYKRNSKIARLYTIAVGTDFRRRGIAQRLLKEAEKKAVRRGRRLMRLEARADDAAPLKLYESSGYRQFGRKPRYYAGRYDALLFEKSLGMEPRRRS
jgi:ribosomal protein S18 acetylase RimI-like enzyme